MSTFLTQGNFSKPTKTEDKALNQQLQTSLLYAPFVKPTDKVRKDVAELSFSDFQAKRFALNYDPPMIILEYLVPSTGKLYHHKMKLRQLTPDSDPDEMIEYLKKRHPLYFMTDKFNPTQITDLINRLKFKLKQREETMKAKDKMSEQSKSVLTGQRDVKKVDNVKESLTMKTQSKQESKQENKYDFPSLNSKPNNQGTSFKSGSQLPSVSDQKPSYGVGSANNKYSEINKQFAQMDLKNDFGDDFEDEDEEEEEEDGDFDANELLNLTDYQNKRKQIGSTTQSKSNTINAKEQSQTKVGKDGAIELSHDYYDEEEEDDDNGWGDDWGYNNKKDEDLDNFDYNNTNLNKLSDVQLEKHKKKMDEVFVKKQLKPGDPGFVYDKRIDFATQKRQDASWDEDDVDEYFDDDFVSPEALEEFDAFEWSMIDEQSEHNQLLADFRKNKLRINDDLEGGSMTIKESVRPTHASPEKYDLNQQPPFHRRNRGIVEGCCTCFTERCDLNRRERLLFDLYNKLFGSDDKLVPEKLHSTEWQEIGFQSKNPRTDFRGGGVLALHCLRYFTSVYSQEFQSMRYDRTGTFFLAITSINITHMLITYFYMNKAEVTEHSKKLRAGRKQFKRFARLNAQSKKAFYELHSFLFIFLYRLWIEEYEKVRPAMPNFQSIVDQTRQSMHEFLENQVLSDIDVFKSSWKGLIAIRFSQQQQ